MNNEHVKLKSLVVTTRAEAARLYQQLPQETRLEVEFNRSHIDPWRALAAAMPHDRQLQEFVAALDRLAEAKALLQQHEEALRPPDLRLGKVARHFGGGVA